MNIGDFRENRLKLSTDKLVGNYKACIGFVLSDTSSLYMPNTVLNINTHEHIDNPLRIIATYRKKKYDTHYNELVYKAKNVDLEKITFPDKLSCILKPE